MVELREQAGSLYHSDDAFGNSPRSQDANALDRGLTAQIPAVICALIGPNLDIGGILLVKSDPPNSPAECIVASSCRGMGIDAVNQNSGSDRPFSTITQVQSS